MTEAEMDACSECDVPIWPSSKVEPLGVLVRHRVQIGGREHGHDLVSRFKLHAAKYRVLSNKARLGELHRRDEAEEFFDRETCAAPILHQPISKPPISQQFEHRPADEMRGCLVPGKQQQEDHRHHLVATEALALLFHADEFGSQAFAAADAGRLQMHFQEALHCGSSTYYAPEKPNSGPHAGDVSRPGHE